VLVLEAVKEKYNMENASALLKKLWEMKTAGGQRNEAERLLAKCLSDARDEGMMVSRRAIMSHIDEFPDLGHCEWHCTSAAPLKELLDKVRKDTYRQLDEILSHEDGQDFPHNRIRKEMRVYLALPPLAELDLVD
jgi:hypothetical protein